MAFEGLLNKRVKIKRLQKSTNEFGEVGYETVVIADNVKTRIQTEKSPGLKREIQGAEVLVEYKDFFLPDTDIRATDLIENGNLVYQVLQVRKQYDSSNLHHLEVELRKKV